MFQNMQMSLKNYIFFSRLCKQHGFAHFYRILTDTYCRNRHAQSRHLSFQQVNWLPQLLCSHPIKSCQIDFDNKFSIKVAHKITVGGDACMSFSTSVCVCMRAFAHAGTCAAFRSCLRRHPPFHFLPCSKKETSLKIRKTRCATNRNTCTFAQTT